MIQKGMAIDPAARFQSMEEYAREIESTISDLEEPRASRKVLALAFLCIVPLLFLPSYLYSRTRVANETNSKSIANLKPAKMLKYSSGTIMSVHDDVKARQMCDSSLLSGQLSNVESAEILRLRAGVTSSPGKAYYLFKSLNKLNNVDNAELQRIKCWNQAADIAKGSQMPRTAIHYQQQILNTLKRIEEPPYISKLDAEIDSAALFARIQQFGQANKMLLNSLQDLKSVRQNDVSYDQLLRLFYELHRDKESNILLAECEEPNKLIEMASISMQIQKIAAAKSFISKARQIWQERYPELLHPKMNVAETSSRGIVSILVEI